MSASSPPAPSGPFTRTFAVNAELGAALDAEEVGILTWAVRGCAFWQASGLQPPPAVLETTEAYRMESDLLAQFAVEACEYDAECEVRAQVLYDR